MISLTEEIKLHLSLPKQMEAAEGCLCSTQRCTRGTAVHFQSYDLMPAEVASFTTDRTAVLQVCGWLLALIVMPQSASYLHILKPITDAIEACTDILVPHSLHVNQAS